MILQHLMEAKDDSTLKHILDILKFLSITDSNVQAMFRSEEAIPYLLKLLDCSKDSSVQFQIILILGNLSYSCGGGPPHNREVIKQCGGIKKIIKLISPELSSTSQRIILNTLMMLSWGSEENGIEVVSGLVEMLNNKNEDVVCAVLQMIDIFLSEPLIPTPKSVLNSTNTTTTGTTTPSASPVKNLPATPNTTTTHTTAKTSILTTMTHAGTKVLPPPTSVLTKMFIDLASVTLMNLQVVSSHNELTDLARSLLRKHSYAGAEEKLLGDLIQELWSTNPSSKRMAIETMAMWTKKNPAAIKPLEEAVRTRNAMEPLMLTIKKSYTVPSSNPPTTSVPQILNPTPTTSTTTIVASDSLTETVSFRNVTVSTTTTANTTTTTTNTTVNTTTTTTTNMSTNIFAKDEGVDVPFPGRKTKSAVTRAISSDSKILLPSLQLIKRVTKSPNISSLLLDTEEQSFIHILVHLIHYGDHKIQKMQFKF
eukprot:TRINITY_DN24980_c0_g1_i1.p1 TRINITY_DN24980_c0_g1~~TRINITY_DN24980_c0_g1_i1.p1  ORF type:complete len:481 (-),score=98.34 TRINITY_DN24980_c0_g1_i1:506-1948(-)